MRRSSSAWAKNALASFRMSLALRSSRTSRSRSLMRCACSVVRPSRWPLSRSCCLTQLSSVCAVQPILPAMDSMQAHCDGCRCHATVIEMKGCAIVLKPSRSGILRCALAASLALLSLQAGAHVYRCGNSYSTVPCTGGTTVETAPPVQSQGATSGNTVTLYLCESFQGGKLWTRDHCRARNAVSERMESVPAGIPFERQVELARSQRDRGLVLSAPPPDAPQVLQNAEPDRRTQCAWLDERIKQLDAMARAGGSAYYMDWVANERKLTRDRQFRIRC